MKVVLYGASGMIGSRILNELISRGHQVIAVVRDTSKVRLPGVAVRAGDVLDAKSVAETAKGADAVISAYAPPANGPEKVVDATRTLVAALRQAGVRRFLMVGGAGGLEVAPGHQLVDTAEFPEAVRPVAVAHRDALKVLEGSDLDWTNLSPAALIQPGARTGKFRLGKDGLITDGKGESRISAEDYAVALVDELEKPEHVRQRFTLAY
jgi:hypothetical protein